MTLIRIFQTFLIAVTLSIVSSCGDSEKTAEKAKLEKEQMEQVEDEGSHDRSLDEVDAEMQNLEGIEKHFVHGNLKRYRSLLKFKGNKDYKLIEDFLPVLDTPTKFVEIKELDAKNGFVKYQMPEVDCVEEITYWKTNDGSHLIGKTQVCCTMFCEGEINFQSYDPVTGAYSNLENSNVIDDYKRLEADLANQHKDGGVDHKYVLPQKGLDLQFCLGDACVDLKWNNGTFTLQE